MRKITLPFIILSSLIFSSCNMEEKINEPNSEEDIKIEITEKTNLIEENKNKNFEQVFSWIKKEYKQDEEFNSCMNFATNNCLWEVIRQDSFKKLDETICDNLLDDYSKQNCKDTVFDLKALDKKEVKYCDEITDKYMKNNCRYKIFRTEALEKKDISICENIVKNNKEVKTSTWIVVWESNFIQSVDECINSISLQLSIDSKDTTYCNKITDDYLKKECKNSNNIDKTTPNADDIISDWPISDFLPSSNAWEDEWNSPADLLIR